MTRATPVDVEITPGSNPSPAGAPSPVAGLVQGARRFLRRRRTATGMDYEVSWFGPWRFTSGVVICAVAALLVVGSYGQYNMSVVSLGCAYLVAALGYNVIVGYNGQLAFGQAGFLAISAYVFAVLEQAHVSTILSAVAGVLVSIAAAAVLGLAVIRARHFYLALITLAFAQAVILLVERWPATHGDDGIAVNLNGNNTVYVSIVVAAIALLFVDRLVRSRFGRAMAMVKSDDRVAEALGVPSALTRVVAGAIGGGLGGVGGVLLAGTLGYITPQNFSIDLTVLLLTMIVVGGLGSVWGTIVGTLLIVILNQAIASTNGWQDIIYGVVLYASLALMPGGLVMLPQRAVALWARVRPTSGGTR
jgi:branched-chain amino acid transport system permease protein